MDREMVEILNVQSKFALGMKKNDFSKVEDIFCKNVRINIFQTGEGQGFADVCRLLHYPGPAPEEIKQNVENVMTRYHGDKAQQSFHMILLYSLHDGRHEFHFMQYGGTFILSYRKEKDKWKISRVLFDLCWLDGNSYWIKDWKMIDFHMPKAHKQVIHCLEDGVTHVIPVNDDEWIEEEKISEILFMYGWVIDTEDYGAFYEIALTDVVIEDGYHGKQFNGSREWIDYLTFLNKREPCLHHTYRIKDIQIDGDCAVAKMSRIEPNRIGSNAIGEHNYYMYWFTLDYTIDLVKESGNWKLKKVSFRKHIYGV